MRILLDECLPRGLRGAFPGHEAVTVQERGWSGVQNGALLRRAVADGFAVFVTIDKGIEFQQSVRELPLAVIALRARSNDITTLQPLMAEVLVVMESVRPGQCIRVPAAAR